MARPRVVRLRNRGVRDRRRAPRDLARPGVGRATAGLLVAVFALTYGLSAPIVAAIVVRWRIRAVLRGATGLFVVANIAAVVAPSFAVLLVNGSVGWLGTVMAGRRTDRHGAQRTRDLTIAGSGVGLAILATPSLFDGAAAVALVRGSPQLLLEQPENGAHVTTTKRRASDPDGDGHPDARRRPVERFNLTEAFVERDHRVETDDERA